MSLAAPQHDVSDAEAMARAQRAHEPSMEEILASIRAIIADERDPAPAKPGPQLVYASDAQGRPPLAEPHDAALGGEPPPREDPIVSEETASAVSGSFRTLSEQTVAHGLKVAEEMTREMLRPLLRSWIDTHMPGIVERLVKAEIQRFARNLR